VEGEATTNMKEKELLEYVGENDLTQAIWVYCPKFGEMILEDYCVQNCCHDCEKRSKKT